MTEIVGAVCRAKRFKLATIVIFPFHLVVCFCLVRISAAIDLIHISTYVEVYLRAFFVVYFSF